jgi:hypothetical protein
LIGCLPPSTLFLHNLGDGQYHLLLPGTRRDLHANGESLRGLADRYGDCWGTEQVKPCGVAPGVEVIDCLAVDLPTAVAVAKCRNSSNRTKQDGERWHLFEDLRAQSVPHHPSLEQCLSRMRTFGSCPTGELLQNRTELVFSTSCHGVQQHGSPESKQLPPQGPRLFQTLGTKGLNLESGPRQRLGCGPYSNSSFWCNRSAAIVLKIADAQPLQFFKHRPAYRDESRERITVLWPLDGLKQHFHVSHGTRHGANHPEQGKGTKRRREVSGSRNAPRSGLQTANAAEVRGHSNGATPVTADSAG